MHGIIVLWMDICIVYNDLLLPTMLHGPILNTHIFPSVYVASIDAGKWIYTFWILVPTALPIYSPIKVHKTTHICPMPKCLHVFYSAQLPGDFNVW